MDETKFLLALYAETDYEQVDNIFLESYKRGIPVKSIKDDYEGGSESLLSECSAVLFVISRASLSSPSLSSYIQQAAQQNKHIIPYFLDDPDELQISRSLFLLMDGSATIPACDYADDSALVQRVLSELKPYFPEAFEPKKKKKPPVLSFLATAALCVMIVLTYIFWIRPSNQEKMLTHVRQSTAIIYVADEDQNYSSGTGFFLDTKGTNLPVYKCT